MRVYLPRVRDPDIMSAECVYPHYWSEETKSFTEDLEYVTAFPTKKDAEVALFWVTAQYAKSIMGQGMKVEVVKKQPGEVFAEERIEPSVEKEERL